MIIRSPALIKGASSKRSASRPTSIILERLGKVFFGGIGRIFERFLHFLGQALHPGNPLSRLASEVLVLNDRSCKPDAASKSCQVIRAIRRAVARTAMVGFLPSG